MGSASFSCRLLTYLNLSDRWAHGWKISSRIATTIFVQGRSWLEFAITGSTFMLRFRSWTQASLARCWQVHPGLGFGFPASMGWISASWRLLGPQDRPRPSVVAQVTIFQASEVEFVALPTFVCNPHHDGDMDFAFQAER